MEPVTDNVVSNVSGGSPATNALSSVESGGFLPGIPFWVYLLVAVFGLAIAVLLFVVANRSRHQPGGNTVPMTFAILSLVLLTVVPLVLMTISLATAPSESSPNKFAAPVGVNEGSDASGKAAGAVPANAMFLVGRWSPAPGCARTMEIRADGTMVSPTGQTATWAAQGSPPIVTLNLPDRAITGTLQQVPEGVRIVQGSSGEGMTLYRCASAPAAPAGGGATCPGVVREGDPAASAGGGTRNRLVVTTGAVTWNGLAVDPQMLRQYLEMTRVMQPVPTLVTRVEPGTPSETVEKVREVISATINCQLESL